MLPQMIDSKVSSGFKNPQQTIRLKQDLSLMACVTLEKVVA
jgi:hypothetical protein